MISFGGESGIRLAFLLTTVIGYSKCGLWSIKVNATYSASLMSTTPDEVKANGRLEIDSQVKTKALNKLAAVS